MYIVKLHCKSPKFDYEWTYTWDEYFSSLKAAVGFGMRAYRKFYEVLDFRVEKMKKREGWAERMW